MVEHGVKTDTFFPQRLGNSVIALLCLRFKIFCGHHACGIKRVRNLGDDFLRAAIQNKHAGIFLLQIRVNFP